MLPFGLAAGPSPIGRYLACRSKQERHSGFLLPWGGETTLNGFEFELPYYWAIRQDMDATFYAHYMQNRGLMGGIEYRIDNPEWGKGIWMFNFLDDQAEQVFFGG